MGRTTKDSTADMMQQAQWDLNSKRFNIQMNVLEQFCQLLGISIIFDVQKGTADIAYHPETATFKLPKKKTDEQLKETGQALWMYFMDHMEHSDYKQEPQKIEAVATVDDSVHIANNKVVMGEVKKSSDSYITKLMEELEIIREIKDDGSIIYRIDKEGRKKRSIDLAERYRIEFEKKPKWKQAIIHYWQFICEKAYRIALLAALVTSLLCNGYQYWLNDELLDDKKEYLILRWHSNCVPDNKEFMMRLDSLVSKEGIDDVYQRVVEQVHHNKN